MVPSQWASGTEIVTHPYRGVTHIVRTETLPRVEHINVIQIDLTTPGLRFKVTDGNANQPANSAIRETTAATTLSYLTSQNGQLAINAHFYQPNSSDANRWVVGLAASQGNIYSSFEGPTSATSNPVGSLTLTQNYAIMTHAPALNIDGLNNAQVVHYDAGFPDKKHVLEPVTLYNAVSGSAQIVTNGVTTIPTYTQNAATGLIDGGGTPPQYSAANSWYNGIRARTAIGLTSDNHTLVLFTIDEAGGSVGMTVGEVADMMRNDYGVYNALNLDGGGSTTMALQDPVTHVRSVINTPTSGQRVVATSLVVFADPEITVEQPAGTNLIDGSATIDCGSVTLGSTSAAFTFTVKNTGAADLTGLAVNKTGANSGEFTVSALGATTLAPDTSTTFTVSFAPGATGPRTAALRIVSNDADENPFDINLTGTGAVTAIQQWRQTHFGSIANSGDGADLNDFEHDGIPNLLEFAFGLHPKQNSAGMLPQPQQTTSDLVISFNTPGDVSGITYGAEMSQTLLPGSWTALADTGNPPQHTFSVPIGTFANLYMRLKVTNP
jgi:exopolysaccharide biosynthesis protein